MKRESEFSLRQWLSLVASITHVLMFVPVSRGLNVTSGEICTEFFPRIMVQTSDFPKYHFNQAVELHINKSSCQPVIAKKFDTALNIGLAANPTSGTLCARPPFQLRTFSCWDASQNLIIDGNRDLPERPLDKTYRMVMDSHGRNLYWAQDHTDGHLYVTSLITKKSKVVVSEAGDVWRLAVDTDHGLIFWASTNNIFEARIENQGRGSPSQIFISDREITDMTIDAQNQYIYWCVTHSEIQRKCYVGNDFEQHSLAAHPYGFVRYNTLRYFQGYLYFIRGTDKQGHVLTKFNWETKKGLDFFIGLKNLDVRALLIYELGSNMPADPCEPLDCSHLCLPLYPDGRGQCVCPSHMSWNGTTCTADPLILLTSVEAKLELGEMSVEQLVLSKQQFSEKGVESVLELANIIDSVSGIQVISASIICFKILGNPNPGVRCFNLDDLDNLRSSFEPDDGREEFQDLLSRFLAVPTHSPSRVISAATDGRHGFVFSLDQQQCIHVLNVATKNIWKAYCVPNNEMDTRYVDIDPSCFDLYYRSASSGGFYHVSLRTKERKALKFSDPDIPALSTPLNLGSLLCHDPVHERLMWVSGTSIKSTSITSNKEPFKVYKSRNGTTALKQLRCITGRPHWVEVGRDSIESIVTLDDEMLVAEKIYVADEGKRILDFKRVNDCDPGHNNTCSSLNCSYGCVSCGNKPTKSACFCPENMILSSIQDNTCQLEDKTAVIESKKISTPPLFAMSWNGSTCTEYFPRIMVQVSDIPQYQFQRAIEVGVKSCRVHINQEIKTGLNIGLAVDSSSGLFCGRPMLSEQKLWCWISSSHQSKIKLLDDGILPGPLDPEADNRMHFDPEEQNLYWKQVETDSHLFVTSLVTRVSKVLLRKPGNLLRMTVDTVNGIIFWASYRQIFQAPIKNRGYGTSSIIETSDGGKEVISITADTLHKYLYWCMDHKTVYRKPYSGGPIEKHVLRTGTYGDMRWTTMHHFMHDLYFIRGGHPIGHVLSKLRWESKQESQLYLGMRNLDLKAMEIYERHNRVVPNPCTALNCSHLCLPSHGQGAQCACPSYMKWNGSACTTDSLIMMIHLNEDDDDGTNAGQVVLFKQRWYEIGLRKRQPVELTLAVGDNFKIEAAINSEFCIKSQVNGTTSCHYIEDVNDSEDPCTTNVSSSLQILMERGFEKLLNQYEIIHVHSDGKRGYFFALDLQQLCVYVLNVATSNIWNAFCASDLPTIANYLAIDPERMLLFYPSVESRTLRKISLITKESRDLVRFRQTLQSSTSLGPRMCAASDSDTLFWMSGKTIKWISYQGGDAKDLQGHSNAKDILQLTCSTTRVFWLQIDTYDYYAIVTFNPELLIAEIIYRAVGSEKILDFRFFRNFGPAYDTGTEGSCLKLNCSHGCVRDGKDPNSRCVCPSDLVLTDSHSCSPARVLAITDGNAFKVLESNNSGSSFDLDERRYISEYVNLTSKISNASPGSIDKKERFYFDLVLKEGKSVFCWMDTFTLNCKLEPKGVKFIGYMTADNPVFDLKPDGTEIIWNTNETGRFKVTKLRTNESLSFNPFPMQVHSSSLVAIDPLKALVFWCDNTDQVVQSKLLLSADPTSKILYRWTRLSTSSSSTNCTSIVNDPFGERIFAIHGEILVMISYASSRSGTSSGAVQVSNLKYVGGRNLVYRNQVLYWISDKGELQYLTVPPDSTTNRSVTPSTFHTKDTRIKFARSLHKNVEELENDACAREKCPVFCFMTHSISTVYSEANCICSDGKKYIRESLACENEASTFTNTIVVTITFLTSMFMFILCVAVWFCIKRRKVNQNLVFFLNGSPNYAYDEDSPPYEALPLTNIITPGQLNVDKSQVLGKGHYGVVYSGLLDGEKVAVKTLRSRFDEELLLEFAKELKIMTYVGDHENVVRFLGAEISRAREGVIWAVLEMSPLGCLETYLRKHEIGSVEMDSSELSHLKSQREPSSALIGSDKDGSPQADLSLPVLVFWLRQIANGMVLLESKNIVHGDLAARNVLVFPNHVVKISDFGYSKKLYQNSSYLKKKQVALPWRWAAPETLEVMEFSTKSDVWAFGVTAWEIFSLGNVPFPQMVWSDQFVSQIKKGLRLQKPDLAPEDLYENAVGICWDLKPDKRPSFVELRSRIDQMYGGVIASFVTLSNVEYQFVLSPD